MNGTGNFQFGNLQKINFQWDTEFKMGGGKTSRTATVDWNGKSYKITVGYNVHSLKCEHAEFTEEQIHKLIMKAVEQISGEEVSMLSGKTVEGILEQGAIKEARIIEGKDVQQLDDLLKSGNTQQQTVAKTAQKVMECFSNLDRFSSSATQDVSPIHTGINAAGIPVKTPVKIAVEEKPVLTKQKQPVDPVERNHCDPGYEAVNQTRLQGPSTGREIATEFKSRDGKRTYGKETISEIAGIDNHIEIYEKKKAYLEEKLVTLTDEKEKAECRNRIRECEEKIKNANEQKKYFKTDWINSNYTRDVLRAADNIEDANKKFISAPVNFRHQKLEVNGKEEIGFFRCGIMHDPRNGYTDLMELRELQRYGQLHDSAEYEAEVDRKIADLQKMNPKTDKQRQAVDHAINLFKKCRGSPAYLDFVIQDRKAFLEDQMTQLVSAQIEENLSLCGDLGNRSNFTMFHLGLLNRKAKYLKNENGWVHIEEHMMADMAQIFKEWRGKTLLFDGKGPFVDDQGVVHLPMELRDANGNPKILKLQSFFMNTSVQVHTKNDGIQATINLETRFAMGDILEGETEEFKKCMDRIVLKGESSFEVAEDLLLALPENAAKSQGCLSCKDRGGTVGARVVLRKLEKAAKLTQSTMNRFVNAMYDEDKGLIGIIKRNTGAKVAKVDPTLIPGGISLFNRIGMLFTMLKERLTGGLEV